MSPKRESSDLLVFSHHRWDFVTQRPHHLLSRQAKHRRVFYFEDPIFGMTELPRLHIRETLEGVLIVIPYLPKLIHPENVQSVMRDMVDELVFDEELQNYTVWYYDSMALSFTDHLEPVAIVFDCMDESSLSPLESELLKVADVVFTGCHSLYEARKKHHSNIHAFPSSVDRKLFCEARSNLVEPEDQIEIPHPRLGFYGVVDERFDAGLLAEMANLKPEFQFVIVGPILRDHTTLPKAHNIHYLGKKDYFSLPLYLAGWDCAILPYVLDESTRYVAANSTPEFLAAGKPVVATAIKDVINPYGNAKLVYIARKADEFLKCVAVAMNERQYDPEWMERVEIFLDMNSWDMTFEEMSRLENEAREKKSSDLHPVPPALNLAASRNY